MSQSASAPLNSLARSSGALLGLARLVFLCVGVTAAAPLDAQNLLPADFSSPSAIEQRLQKVKTELQQSSDQSDPLSRQLLQNLETALFQHRAAIKYLQAKQGQLNQALEATRSWKSFDQPGPFSIQFADDLRAKMAAIETIKNSDQNRTRILFAAREEASDQLALSQRTERQLQEQADTAMTPQEKRTALAALRNENIRSRTEAEKVAYLGQRLQGVQAELASLAARYELLDLQLKSIDGRIEFSQSELDSILERVASERAEVLKELNTADDQVQASTLHAPWLAEFLDVEEKFWKTRHQALAGAGLVERKSALDVYNDILQTVTAWMQIGQLMAAESLKEGIDGSRVLDLRAELARLLRLQSHLTFAIEEVDGTSMSVFSVLDSIADTVITIWDTELYLAEDTSSLDGQRVTTYRAITLGKLVWLAFILTVGWLVLRYLSRQAKKFAHRRPGVTPESADSIGNWIFGVGLALLIIFGLNRVHIPFTAFAFLGGTLAIGIGFGAQTLLKNFISGIIISLERPFRVGDLIEVEDITGRIRRMGWRASVIEHFDGVSTLIPNSNLLENRINNWTFGQTSVRGAVSVGVAYGSPTREVSRALLAVAHQHGQVLDHPEPEVRFTDFGDNALVFQLLYWVDASRTQRERLASDLRFMIDKALTEANIGVPFPQRDIHFDTNQPLRVEVSSPENRIQSDAVKLGDSVK